MWEIREEEITLEESQAGLTLKGRASALKDALDLEGITAGFHIFVQEVLEYYPCFERIGDDLWQVKKELAEASVQP